MRTLEFAVGVFFAVVIFVGLKIIGMVIKFTLVAAIVGFIAGLLLARSYRSKAN